MQAVYLYDDNGTPLAIVQAANSPYNSTSQDKLVYLQTDHLGTPRLATDAAKRTVWKWESDAFGNTAPVQDPDGDGLATTINLRFAGQYYDAESGLHYHWHRTYDPSLGRYLSSDPIGLDGGLNTFGYVFANPLGYVDLYGLSADDVAKIHQTIQDSINNMTNNGQRTSPWYNNAIRNLTGFPNGPAPYDPNKYGHYLQCHEQVEEVNKALEVLQNSGGLDDKWIFSAVNNYHYILGVGYGHTTGEALSYNPNDHLIEYDPFYGKW